MPRARATPESTARVRAEDVRLIRLHRGGDPHAREALIRRYVPLARGLAWRYHRGPESLDDLVQVASLGLVKAVDRWDPDRGHAFSSFAVPTILGELRRYFRDLTWVVRPPRALMELTLAVERARDPLCAAIGREPTTADLAIRLGRSPEAVAEALQAAEGRSLRSLDSPVHDEEDEPTTFGDLVGRDDDGYERAEVSATIERLVSTLDDKAREILRLRFEEDLLQSEIAELVGCSQMQVSRSLRASLDRLQVHAAAA